MSKLALPILLFVCLTGCAAATAVGAVVETGANVAKTGVKAGGAVAEGAIDAVDADGEPEDE